MHPRGGDGWPQEGVYGRLQQILPHSPPVVAAPADAPAAWPWAFSIIFISGFLLGAHKAISVTNTLFTVLFPLCKGDAAVPANPPVGGGEGAIPEAGPLNAGPLGAPLHPPARQRFAALPPLSSRRLVQVPVIPPRPVPAFCPDGGKAWMRREKLGKPSASLHLSPLSERNT